MVGALNIEFEFRNQRFKDAEVGLRAFTKSIAKDFNGSAEVLKRELRKFLNSVAEAMRQRHGNRWPGGTTPRTLSKRSGELLRSVQDSIKVTGTTFTNLQGRIGGNKAAKTHEFGATITIRRAKWLTIPLPAALDARGVPIKQKARDWDRTFFLKSKKGNLLLAQRRGSKVVPLYVLKKSVVIPPRLGLGETLEAGVPFFVDTAMDRIVKEVLNG